MQSNGPERRSRALRRGRHIALVALAVALACQAGASAAPSTTPSAAPGASSRSSSLGKGKATFGIGAANAKDLDGRPYLNYTTSPGARTSDHVVVQNYGHKPIKLTLYPADGVASSDGGIGFAPRSKPNVDAGNWITFPHGARSLVVHLAPRSDKVIPISIAVPGNASPGDHLAGVMAAFQGLVVGKSGQQIKLEQRIGLRALFRVSGDIKAVLSIENLHADYHGTLNPFGAGSATVTYTVRNAGNVLLSGNQKLNVTGVFGTTGSTSKIARTPLLLPGAHLPMRVEVHHVWPQLLMHARVTVTALGVAGAANPQLVASSASVSFWAVPWTLIALIVVLIALVVGFFVWRHRLNARPAAHGAKPRKPVPAIAGES